MLPEKFNPPQHERMDEQNTGINALGETIERAPYFAFLRELATECPTSEAYLVGGIVRDAILGREAKDYDFVVRGVPATKLEKFLASRGTVNLVGRTFGVFKFRPHDWPAENEDIDIALPRTEHAEGTGGYRDFDVQADPSLAIADDLSRRDFTINAMAWDTQQHCLIDPFHGRNDIEVKTIRAVGNPHERFTEDRSRILRALRFACQLGPTKLPDGSSGGLGFTIDPTTMVAIRKHMATINEQRSARKVHDQTTLIRDVEYITPREIIAREIIKSFDADPVRALDLWDEAGAFDALIPELRAMKNCPQPPEFHSEGDVWQHTRLALTKLRSVEYGHELGDDKPSALVTIGILLHDIGKPLTLKTPERDKTDRIRFDGHDRIGGELARAIAHRLALASPFPKNHRLHINPDDLGWIVDHHLLLLQNPTDMRNATIERYFFDPNVPGEALQRLAFCDGSAAIPAGASECPDLANWRALRVRISEIAALVEERNRLPRPVLDGRQIMERLKLKPGPQIGQLIEALREEQLTRLQRGETMTEEEACAFLAPLVGKHQIPNHKSQTNPKSE
ncbi:MAG: HD domain-containing protein [Candidatus Uhrbacteria bacterium]